MSEKCFEQGMIQAFIDGETEPELSLEITSHSAACSDCALLIQQAEEENTNVFALLDREIDTLVPTQRLWSSISAAIAVEKRRHSFWERVRQGLVGAFSSPSIAVAASVVLVFSIFAAVWALRSPTTIDAGPVTDQPNAANLTENQRTTAAALPTSDPMAVRDRGITETRLPADRVSDLVRTAEHRPKMTQFRAQPAVAIETAPATAYLPGEQSYVRTIASLKENVDARKDMVMSPSARIAFERDLAVVDDSINKMKQVVRKEPKNQAAKQVLYSSYQNKIDLLNSVVDRGELMASLQ